MKKQMKQDTKFDRPKMVFVPKRGASIPPGICKTQCNQKNEPSTRLWSSSFQANFVEWTLSEIFKLETG